MCTVIFLTFLKINTITQTKKISKYCKKNKKTEMKINSVINLFAACRSLPR